MTVLRKEPISDRCFRLPGSIDIHVTNEPGIRRLLPGR